MATKNEKAAARGAATPQAQAPAPQAGTAPSSAQSTGIGGVEQPHSGGDTPGIPETRDEKVERIHRDGARLGAAENDEAAGRETPANQQQQSIPEIERSTLLRHQARYCFVGMPVQFFNPREDRVHERIGKGPYAAIVTEVIDRELGIVNLNVSPPLSASYGLANVSPGGAALGDVEEGFWSILGFYD